MNSGNESRTHPTWSPRVCRSDLAGLAGAGTAPRGVVAGDNGQDNAAHAPWAWDDTTDGSELQAGGIATDPACLISRYFGTTAPLDLTYTRTSYRQ